MGKGPGSVPLQSPQHCHQRSEVFSSANTDCDQPGNGNHEPLFEGFSFPGEGFRSAHANYRISVLQAPKHHVQTLSAGSPLISLPSSPRRSPLNEVSAVAALRSLGFCERVSCSRLDSRDKVGSSLVVRLLTSSGGCLSGLPTT